MTKRNSFMELMLQKMDELQNKTLSPEEALAQAAFAKQYVEEHKAQIKETQIINQMLDCGVPLNHDELDKREGILVNYKAPRTIPYPGMVRTIVWPAEQLPQEHPPEQLENKGTPEFEPPTE